MTIKGYKQTPEHIAKKTRRGRKHYRWAGSAVSEKGGRKRALRMYPNAKPCRVCGAERGERHHKDGNTANNKRSNIEFLCRKCHMRKDGRLARVKRNWRKLQRLGVAARWA